jgi:hypothetical protein
MTLKEWWIKKKLKGAIGLFNIYLSQHWFIVSKGLEDEYLDFDKDFTPEKLDDIKQKIRRGK